MRIAGIAVLCGLFLATGCRNKSGSDDNTEPKGNLPADVQQWVDKLGSKDDVGKALDALEKLNNPAAIPALIEGWKKRQADGQFLRAVIKLAHNAKAKTVVSTTVPFFVSVAKSVMVKKPPSKNVDQAVKAIRVLRDVRTPAAHAALVDVCAFPAEYSYGQRATIVACLSLADRPGDASHKALLTALNRGARTKSANLAGAAARALGKRAEQRSLGPLCKGMYIAPKAFPSIREAILRMGPPTIPKMMAIFAGVDAEINKLAKAVKMTRPQMMRQSALMLGDLYYGKAVPHLIESLKQPGMHHESVFIALTQIADATAAKHLLAYALNTKNKKKDRINAVGAYGVLAADGKELPKLLAWLRREKDASVRNIVSLTSAQLVRSDRNFAALNAALPKKNKVSRAAHAVASLGALCGDDPDCYLLQVESLPKDLHLRLTKLKGFKLSAKQIAQIKAFMDVRSLTDVVKLRGKKKAPLPTLLRILATATVAVHQQLLYAIVHTAPRPCPKCVKRFDVLLARKSRVSAQVTQGLRMIRSYLSWAK